MLFGVITVEFDASFDNALKVAIADIIPLVSVCVPSVITEDNCDITVEDEDEGSFPCNFI